MKCEGAGRMADGQNYRFAICDLVGKVEWGWGSTSPSRARAWLCGEFLGYG
ncbi:MAG: hypothetical protein NTNFB02_00540 [Nitrospira sp.]